MNRKGMIALGAIVVSTVVTIWLHVGQILPREQAVMCGIFILAAVLWVSEAVPLYATAILVVGLQVVLLANPGEWPGLGFIEAPTPGFRSFIASAADPVIVLFFGGFLLAQAAGKVGVDATLAGIILRWVGHRPRRVLAGLMVVTAVFSLWMSNTATAAMMLAMVTPMLALIPKGDSFRKALVLGVAFAANIGGMGTPIASPPNAVAMGFLRNAGYDVGFLQWMLVAVPLLTVLLVLCWVMLVTFYPPHQHDLRLEIPRRTLTGRGWFVIVIFSLTALLWLTEALHGLPASVVALLPAVLFSTTGLLKREDVNSLEWSILILIAGGISLGTGMSLTGLDRTFVQWVLSGGSMNVWWLISAVVMITLALGTFMSNTAAANLLLPIGVSLAVTTDMGIHPTHIAMAIALVASVGMALPISTPPNAMAYAYGDLRTRDLAMIGGALGLIAALLVIFGSKFVLQFWGVIP